MTLPPVRLIGNPVAFGRTGMELPVEELSACAGGGVGLLTRSQTRLSAAQQGETRFCHQKCLCPGRWRFPRVRPSPPCSAGAPGIVGTGGCRSPRPCVQKGLGARDSLTPSYGASHSGRSRWLPQGLPLKAPLRQEVNVGSFGAAGATVLTASSS